VSETLADHYEAVHGRRPFVIRNAINFAPADQTGSLERFALERDSYLLYAGRISPEKGVHTLLDTLRPLDHDKKLVIAGGSSYSEAYIDELKRSAGDEVIFLGSVDHDSVQELFRNCYAYVLPSEMEGLSIALLEALSHGTCIVTTDIPENVEVVGEAALTFPPGDELALRAHLVDLLGSPSLVADLRQRALARAVELPDWDTVATLTEELYFKLLLDPGSSRL
jgi:glycosyltransferase involved in cell wall biosynthesis